VTLQVLARYYLGQARYARGEYRQAAGQLERAVAALTGDLLHDRLGQASHPSVSTRAWLIRCLAELGEFPRAVALADEALEIGKRVDFPGTWIGGELAVGELYVRKAEPARAIPVLERGLERGRVADLPVGLAHVRLSAGHD
jgi:tetratricopeptide (TPR) repeat protein